MHIRSIVLSFAVIVSGLLMASCGGTDTGTNGDTLPACPTGGTDLTYETFGKQFFNDYCLNCHFTGSTVKGALPYDSQAAIQDNAEEIYKRAGGTNTNMPQSGTKPTSDERQQLAEWLSCGAE